VIRLLRLSAFVVLPALALALAACTSSGDATPGVDESAIRQAAIEWFADQTGLDPDQFSTVRFEAVQWPDGCLGAGHPGQACTLAIVGGYRIVLQNANNAEIELRSDGAGSYFAWAPAHRVAGVVQEHHIAFPVRTDAGETVGFMPLRNTEFIDFADGMRQGDRVEVAFDDPGGGDLMMPAWVRFIER
jgi:hypothetical protein